ncbi:MAG: PP2C family protein-serine/threonine phosphatase [Treponema sp.]|nr:PP2C family protein-serine/threonine phosphatase [Spirochaetia bacterium]MDY2840097.1 PP2C family protein-serine/threonine phosphatase [Treponema sp.]
MYKTRKKIILICVNVVAILLLLFLTVLLLPVKTTSGKYIYSFLLPAVLFIIVGVCGNQCKNKLINSAKKHTLESGETVLINQFIAKLRFCYSLEDFYSVISDILENQGDCSVLVIDKIKDYILYNSPARLTTSESTRKALETNYKDTWPEGFYYFDRHLGVTTRTKKTRGFFMCCEKHHMYVFCKYTRLFDANVFPELYEEYKNFIARMKTISTLSEISATTKEWEQLAENQQSFLPQKIPDIPKLKMAAYYRPLIYVSGDYYSILPIDQSKTMVLLGDVSGKGLSAALIMGLVMNTVKIMEDKEDLVSILRAVDAGIKKMRLQDKYTVMFLGIIDTDKMKIRYINASMSDPIILSPSPNGYRIKPLQSNAGVVGILEIDDNTQVHEQRLFRGDTILIATDGVSEVMDENGVELGDTDLFEKTLVTSAAKTPDKMVEDIVDLIMKYNGDKRLHDDITMLVAKVGY